MNRSLQMWGLAALSFLAALLLFLIGTTFFIIGHHIGPDGRVPSAEAFGITALLLSFREVIATIRSIYDTEARTSLTDHLANSAPGTPAPKDAADAANQVAAAASDTADEIAGK